MYCEELKALVGKTLASVVVSHDKERITFTTIEGEEFAMLHIPDCCETVEVEEVIGDLSDLVGTPITEAEEVSFEDYPAPEYAESYTWTFYRLATAKGFVTIRWFGASNGYYSERVGFVRITPKGGA